MNNYKGIILCYWVFAERVCDVWAGELARARVQSGLTAQLTAEAERWMGHLSGCWVMSGVTRPLLANLSVSALNSFLSREQMKWPAGGTAKIKGSERLFVGKWEVSTSGEPLGDATARSCLYTSVCSCASCIPPKMWISARIALEQNNS